MRKNITLNRPVFAQQVFNSTALTVLTSLFQPFPEEGKYDLVVRRGNTVVDRTTVCVEGTGCMTQRNIDLAKFSPPEGGYQLDVGGVLGFFVSEGTGRYSVTITQMGEREKRVVLNSAEAVPKGSVFAVTLVRPGNYQMRTQTGRSLGRITLRVPAAEERSKYQTEQAVTVEVDEKGALRSDAVNLYTGQSVVFICQSPVQLQIAFEDAGNDTDKPAIDRKSKLAHKRKHPTRGDSPQKPSGGKKA